VILSWLACGRLVLVYLAVAFIIEALFRILLWHTENLDGTESPG
jgi:hypothetical protein